METWKNKLVAIALLAIGCIATAVGGDATALVMLSFLALPMFFAKRNWIC